MTTKFRETHHFDRLLEIPHVKYELIRPYFKSYYYNNAKNGSIVYVDCPGRTDLNAMERVGVSEGDLIFHYMWITEFLWMCVDPMVSTGSVWSARGTGAGPLQASVRTWCPALPR